MTNERPPEISDLIPNFNSVAALKNILIDIKLCLSVYQDSGYECEEDFLADIEAYCNWMIIGKD